MVGSSRQRNNMDVGKITHAPDSQQKGIKTLLKGDDGTGSNGSNALCWIGLDSDKFWSILYIATFIFMILQQ